MASNSSSSSSSSTIEGRRPAEAEEEGDYIVVDEDEDDDRGPGGRNYHRNLEGGGIYTWEKDVEKTWDVFDDLGDRERGGFKDSEYERRVLKRRKQNLTKDDTCKVRKGLTRHLFVIVDMSEAMNEKDFRPNRLSVTIKLLEVFIREYFDQNPISQIGIIVTRNSIAEKITELSGNPSKHIAALKRAAAASGEASLQNALEVARMTLW
jgi:transcription initiation factor TFIIH subunit 2